MMKNKICTFLFVLLPLCSCHNFQKNSQHHPAITVAQAYEGVSNYCHTTYDGNMSKGNLAMMSLRIEQETDSTIHLVFRSYTDAFVHFYVDKATGITRMVEEVPTLHVEEEVGTIDLFDYIEKGN